MELFHFYLSYQSFFMSTAPTGGEQCQAIQQWMTQQKERGGGHNAGLLGGGQHNKRGDGNVVASVPMPLEWKTTRRIGKWGRRV
jgi:hypothetical protein